MGEDGSMVLTILWILSQTKLLYEEILAPNIIRRPSVKNIPWVNLTRTNWTTYW